MAWPCDKQYGITAVYGQKGPYWKTCAMGHTGVDFGAPKGAAVYAPIAGTIRHRSYGKAFGPYQFAISPSAGQPFADYEVFIAHTLDRLPDGTEVQVGQQVARCGDLGNVSAAHIHLEMHSRKNMWACSVMMNPQPAIDHAGGAPAPTPTSWQFPAGHKVYAKYLKWEGHKQNADGVSDSIKAWQEMLNRHKLVGGATLPVTGKWAEMTADETIKCQSQHLPPPDGSREAAFVGPKQFAHVKADVGAPYEWAPSAPPPPPLPPPVVQWFAAPSLLKLKAEVDARWPGRDTSSDGIIGDTAHSTSKSEHNPVGHPHGPEYGTAGCVHAIDITANGIDVPLLLSAVIGDQRVWYVIHDGFIYSKTYNWAQRPYTGANPHRTHVHISLAADDQVSAVRNENDTSQWLEEADGDDEEESWGKLADVLRDVADRIERGP